jgi:hypothetical protein
MAKKFLAKPLPVSFPDAHIGRLKDIARRFDTTAPAIARASVELALDNWERDGQPILADAASSSEAPLASGISAAPTLGA